MIRTANLGLSRAYDGIYGRILALALQNGKQRGLLVWLFSPPRFAMLEVSRGFSTARQREALVANRPQKNGCEPFQPNQLCPNRRKQVSPAK